MMRFADGAVYLRVTEGNTLRAGLSGEEPGAGKLPSDIMRLNRRIFLKLSAMTVSIEAPVWIIVRADLNVVGGFILMPSDDAAAALS